MLVETPSTYYVLNTWIVIRHGFVKMLLSCIWILANVHYD